MVSYFTIIPLSIENESFGKPCIIQDLINTGIPKMSRSWKSFVQTIFKLVQSSTQLLACFILYGVVNAPKYATTPDAINMSPVRR